jgi:uncharacterized protein (UPF0332 family)
MSYISNVIVSSNNIVSSNINTGSYQSSLTVDVDKDLIEFINFAFEILGVDISYQQFKEMTKEERKSILREVKLNKIL